jgi:hypothetical protein
LARQRPARRAFAWWATLGALLCSPAALAQLSLPSVEDQRGLSAGTFRFWPRLDLEGGFDSNVFFQRDNDAFFDDQTAPIGSPVIRVAPGIRIENPEYTDIRFTLDGEASYRRFFSGEPNVDEGQSNVGAVANLLVAMFEKRDFSLRIFDTFTHQIDTPNFSSATTFNRVVNKAGLRVALHPGGVNGRKALEVGAEYAFEFERFVDFSTFDVDMHHAKLYGSWKFFPKTALEVQANLTVRRWLDTDVGQNRVNALPLRVTAGINGFITSKLATTLRVGYGQGFYEAGPDIQTPIGQASLTYTPTSTTVLTGGYQRDFVNSLYGNFYAFDRIFVDAKQRLFGQLDLALVVGYNFLDFARFDPGAAGPQAGFLRTANMLERGEQALEARFTASYDLSRWVVLKLSYEYRHLFSNFAMEAQQVEPIGDTPPSDEIFIIDRGGFERHFVMAGVSLRY